MRERGRAGHGAQAAEQALACHPAGVGDGFRRERLVFLNMSSILLALLHGYVSITHNGNQVVSGTAIVLLAAAVGGVVALTFFVAIVKGFLYICRPNEILIFSGRKHDTEDKKDDWIFDIEHLNRLRRS